MVKQEITQSSKIQPRDLFRKKYGKNFSRSFFFPEKKIFLLPTNPRSEESKLSSYNEVFYSFFLPLQTKGKKVLIAFCMAIKKLL
jgi:hypothetical protein